MVYVLFVDTPRATAWVETREDNEPPQKGCLSGQVFHTAEAADAALRGVELEGYDVSGVLPCPQRP